ncbi:hypothetical protein LARV_00763 [Longilinea arvoryzae]|uniref:Uncharacterized protein n=1 Tax=Longilinea arvoryzae TaxID=360412 RepID=A0A0S7B7H2_9CHLR|nr:hypothetical protein [Longilinea arvoryzae]GAP13022.1 hypothetical protein LARV_00763 [Longilinea arvoryzae]
MNCQWTYVSPKTRRYGRPVDLGTADGIKERCRSRILAESIDVAWTLIGPEDGFTPNKSIVEFTSR